MADYPHHSQSHHSHKYHHRKEEEVGETVCVPSPFDDEPLPPQQRRTQSAVYGYEYQNAAFPPFNKYEDESMLGPGAKKDDFAPPTHYASQQYFGSPPSSSSYSGDAHRARSYTQAPAGYPIPPAEVPFVEGSHICPVCYLQMENPLKAVVLLCPRCDTKYCYFCNERMLDNLPCAKKICRRRCREMWREEEVDFNRYNVKPLKDKASKRLKRKMQSAGYMAGIGACGVASAGLVAAGIAGVPFTAGFSLVLVPAAVIPLEGARSTYNRKKRYNMLLKDKKRQSVRSQIRTSEESESSTSFSAQPTSSTSVSASSFSSSSASMPSLTVAGGGGGGPSPAYGASYSSSSTSVPSLAGVGGGGPSPAYGPSFSSSTSAVGPSSSSSHYFDAHSSSSSHHIEGHSSSSSHNFGH